MEHLNLTVIKRDGREEPFDRDKQNQVIDWAGQNLNVNLDTLKEKIVAFFVDGISTAIIQKQLVTLAISLTTIEEPDWRFVASRLLLLDIYKKSRVTQQHNLFGYPDYVTFVHDAVDSKVYSSEITDKYSDSELREFATVINPKYDLGYDYAGMEMFASRYLFRKSNQTFELPQQRLATIALLAAQNRPKATRLFVAKRYYMAIASRKLSPATPIILNLGRIDGNLASCFITAIGDDLTDIYYTLNQAAQISKNAGGVGVNCSRVRAHGSSIRGVANASGGVNPWIKLFNDTSVSVNQLGSRKGAITVALDVWHADIEDFLELQTENGDQRVKSFDVFPQMVVNDLFIKAWKESRDWYVFCPNEVRNKFDIEIAELWGEEFVVAYEKIVQAGKEGNLDVFKKFKSNDIVRQALQSAVETGLPYWFNKDTVNRANPNKHVGMIGSANLCVESFANFSPSNAGEQYFVDVDGETVVRQDVDPGYVHTCNLVSPNSSLISDEEIPEIAELAVWFLDDLLEVAKPPIPESQMHNDDYRILGIGSLGLADRMAKDGISYGSDESVKYAGKYFETFAYYGILASSNLALDRGRYKYFEGSDWSKGIFFGKDASELQRRSQTDLDWKLLANIVQKQGMRNGGLFAIAPNTSTSLLIGCSASILPIFGKFYTETNGVLSTTFVAQFLSDETFWVYRENKNINQLDVISVVAEIQQWTDQGISFEPLLNLNTVTRATQIAEIYEDSMDAGLKTVYYLRSKVKNDKECTSCAN